MKILVDDIRTFDGVDIIFRDPETAWIFIEGCIVEPVIDVLLLDHDLGEDKMSGVKFLENLFYSGQIFPKQIEIVSANPVGTQNIAGLIESTKIYNCTSYDKRSWTLAL